MDCKDVRQLMVAYLDNEVTAEERRQIDAHLARCQSCRHEMDALAKAQDGLRRAFKSVASDTTPPIDAWDRLQPGLSVSRPSFLFLLRTRRRRLVATIIVVAVVIILGLLWGLGILPGLRS